MKHWTQSAMRWLAYISLLVFAFAAVVNAVTDNPANSVGYVSAMAWVVIFLMWR